MNTLFRTIAFGAVVALSASGNAFATDASGDLVHEFDHDFGATYPATTMSLSHDGIATIAGLVESTNDKQIIERRVLEYPGVTSVRNLPSAH